DSAVRSAPFDLSRGTVTGDLDGDGRRDRIGIAGFPAGAPPCRFALVARLATRRTQTRFLDQGVLGLTPAEATRLRWPHVAALIELDRKRGSDVVVLLAEGASTFFYGLFAERGRRLVRLRIDPRGIDNLVASGASGSTAS